MDDFMSVCFTLKNRADFMRGKLEELQRMNYDPKKLEICVTDGHSTDGLKVVLKSFAKYFLHIKYAVSDRGALPFVVPENNPACDINAQICNVASFEKIVRTDAEVRFRHLDSLRFINQTLTENPNVCICFKSWHMDATYKVGDDVKAHGFSFAKMAFHCSCFTKTAFVQNRGIEEEFVKGFAAEDSYFHQWWRKNRKLVHPPNGYEVLHLWHGRWESKSRLKLKHEFSLPMYKQFLKENHTPNVNNPNWKRPEMISGVEIWKE